MKALSALFVVAALAIVALIAWTATREGFFYPDGLRLVLGTLSGRLMALDFLALLILAGAWIVIVDANRTRGWMLAVLLVIFGTPVLLLYLAARARRVGSVRALLLPE